VKAATRRRTRRVSDRPTDTPSATTADCPPCCNGSEVTPLNHLISETLHLHCQAHDIHVLIDTGCLQVNIISAKIAALLAKDGGPTYGTNIVLTAGVGGQSYGVQGIMNVTVTLMNNDDDGSVKHICLRAIVCREVKIDLIIGLPFILFYNFLPLLISHIAKTTCCEIYMTNTNDNGTVSVAHIMNETDRDLLHFNHRTPTTAITVQRDIAEVEFFHA